MMFWRNFDNSASLFWLFCGLLALLTLWSNVFELDRGTSVSGTIGPLGHPIVIQSRFDGKVLAIHLNSGEKVNKGDKTDGMSKKAVAAYRRENPGSKLKTAVTGKVKKGSKDAKRRKSFCARSKGQQDMHNIDCSKTPDKPVCKARRRWKC